MIVLQANAKDSPIILLGVFMESWGISFCDHDQQKRRGKLCSELLVIGILKYQEFCW